MEKGKDQLRFSNGIFLCDCMPFMREMPACSVDMTLTDIPYGSVNRKGQIRNLDKGGADRVTFDLHEFMAEVDRVTKGTVVIFTGESQFSRVWDFFAPKGTVRRLVWSKTNPLPMNGKYVYLSSTEPALWCRKSGATFNARFKGTVFTYPSGRSKLHPTEKNPGLIREILLDNTNEGQLVFDPCAGSGTHLLVAKECGRRWLGCEIDEKWFETAKRRLEGA